MPTSPRLLPTRLLKSTQAGQCRRSASRAYASRCSKERQYCTITPKLWTCPRKPDSGRRSSSRDHPWHGHGHGQPLVELPWPVDSHPDQEDDEVAFNIGCHTFRDDVRHRALCPLRRRANVLLTIWTHPVAKHCARSAAYVRLHWLPMIVGVPDLLAPRADGKDALQRADSLESRLQCDCLGT